MSRNLGEVHCAFCSGPVIHTEEPRPITPQEAGPYFDHYRNALFAAAECRECGAPYLAWVAMPAWNRDARREPWLGKDRQHFDLSHRHAFNDEPDPEDMPKRAPGVCNALKQLRSERMMQSATYEACLEVAEAWMEAAVRVRDGKPAWIDPVPDGET